MRRRGSYRLLAACALPMATQAAAQTVEIPAIEATEESSDLPVTPAPASPIWIAGINGGLVDRDGGQDSPYATVSLTRFHKDAYLRAAFTAYRSTLTQIDAVQPSTYYVGSIGAGGTFDDWVVDAHLSYGRQTYGQVETSLGERSSAFSSTGYFATGLRAGRVLRPAPRWYVTPTLAVEYVATKSLHQGFEAGQSIDFEVPERAWSGSGALRVDRTFGRNEQNSIGLAVSHHLSDNGQTRLASNFPAAGVSAVPTPDSWQEMEASATVQLGGRRVRL